MDEALPRLFTQTGCAESRQVRDWLTKQGMTFIERKVTGDARAAAELRATGIAATPLLVVGERTVLGFRPAALAQALGLVND